MPDDMMTELVVIAMRNKYPDAQRREEVYALASVKRVPPMSLEQIEYEEIKIMQMERVARRHPSVLA